MSAQLGIPGLLICFLSIGISNGTYLFILKKIKRPDANLKFERILLASGLGAAIGFATANSGLAPEGSFIHVLIGLFMSGLAGASCAFDAVTWAGVGIGVALASPLFGPGVEQIFTDYSVAALVANLLLFFEISETRLHILRKGYGRWVLPSIALMAVAYIFSTIASKSPGTSSLVLFRYLAYLCMPLLLLATDKPRVSWLLYGPCAAGLAFSGLGLWHAIERSLHLGLAIGLYHRLWILGMHPAHTGHWFAGAFPVALAGAFSRKRTTKTISTVAALLFGLVCILSYSRTAWLGLGLGGFTVLGIHALRTLRSTKSAKAAELKSALSASAAIAALLIILFAQGPARIYLERVFYPKAMAHSGRIADFKVSLRMIKESPLIGNGPNSRRILSYKFIKKGDELPSAYFREAGHNAFLKVASEAGIPASLAFIFLLFLAIFFPLKTCGVRDGRLDSLPFAASSTGLVVPFLFGGLLDGPYAMFLAALGAGLALLGKGVDGQRDGLSKSTGSIRIKAILASSGIIILVLALWPCITAGLLRRSIKAANENEDNRALKLASTASHIAPWLAEPQTILAEFSHKTKDFRAEKKAARKAYVLAGGNPGAAIVFARALVETGDYHKALSLISAYDSRALGYGGLMLKLKIQLALGKNKDIAQTTAEIMLMKRPVRKLASMLKASQDLSGEVSRILMRRMEHAMENGDMKNTVEAGLALANYYRIAGDFQKEEKIYKKLINSSSTRTDIIWRLSNNLALQGRSKEAREILKDAAIHADRPARTILLLELGRHLLMEKRYIDAQKALARSLELWRDVYLDPYPCFVLLSRCRNMPEKMMRSMQSKASFTASRWRIELARALKDSPSRDLTKYCSAIWPVPNNRPGSSMNP